MRSQHDLLLQYKKTRRDLNTRHRETEKKEERSLLASMISDVEFVVEWLDTGREPEARRGIDRRSVYQLTQVWDPEWFKEFVPSQEIAATAEEYEPTLSDEFSLDDALTGLSERERQCFVLHVGFDYTTQQIATELNLTRRTVRTHIERAKQKIEENKMKSLYPFVG